MKRALAVIALAGVFLVAGPPSAQAHPLGNFTVNRLAEIVVAPGRLTVAYALDLAEIPAYQTLRELAPDGSPTAATLQGWADRTAEAIGRGLVLRLDGRRSLLEVHHAVATVAPGQGGLETLRLDVRFGATLPSTSGRLSFVDRNDPGRLGWREVVARGADGMALVGSDVPTASVTDGLRTYPEDLLSAPLDVGSM